MYKAGINPDEFFTVTVEAESLEGAHETAIDLIKERCINSSRPIPAHIQIKDHVNKLIPHFANKAITDITPKMAYSLIAIQQSVTNLKCYL